ncbi:MAG: Maf family protein [Sphaerochaeta sp.]
MSIRLNKFFDKIILASASPARRQILLEQGLDVEVRPTNSDESLDDLEDLKIEEQIEELAKRKLKSYEMKYGLSAIPVLCCDTLVYFENTLVGKANSKEEAFETLLNFSDKHQMVYTGYSLYLPKFGIYSGCDEATVLFKHLDPEFIRNYIKTGEWEGAAGSYRIQGKGRTLIKDTLGDFNTIVGLPLSVISDLMKSTLS